MRPKYMKRGDTLPVLEVDFSYDNRGNSSPSMLSLDPISTSVVFAMRSDDGKIVIDDAPASVVFSEGGVVRLRYSWQSGDTDVVGKFWGEFEVAPLGGGILSLPTVGSIPIEIVPDVD